MDLFGSKAQKLLAEAQGLLVQAQQMIEQRVATLERGSEDVHERLDAVQEKQVETDALVRSLQKQIDDLRDSAIRGEVASGVPSKDVAKKFGLSAARVTQIAPRRRYNNG